MLILGEFRHGVVRQPRSDDAETGGADEGRRAGSESHDPFGRIVAQSVFDAFRDAWKAGAGLFELFGNEPVKIKEPVGPDAPNRRPDVAKVETFLGRTGHLDLARTEGPTGYYGSRVDQGIRGFQKENALAVDGLINPDGETLQTFATLLSERQQPSQQAAGFSSIIGPIAAQAETVPERQRPLSAQKTAPLEQRVDNWFGRRGALLVGGEGPSPRPPMPSGVQRAAADADEQSPQRETLGKSALPEYVATPIGNDDSKAAEPAHLRPVLDTIESTYRNRVEGLRRRGMPVAAANLEHFLDGSGELRKLPREEAIKLAPIKEAEATNIERFVRAG